MKYRGFTLIELMIVVAILGIVAIFFLGAIGGLKNQSSTVSFGYGGLVEMRCINGLQFTVSNGHVRQVYDQLGHGVACH